MKGSVVVDSTPVGQYPGDIMELDLIGTVQKEGSVEYGFGGMMGHHNNVVHYFRNSADEGEITLVFNVIRPQAAVALHKLFTLAGRTVRKAIVMAKRDDGSVIVSLELAMATIASLSPVKVSSGTVYLLSLKALKGNAVVTQ